MSADPSSDTQRKQRLLTTKPFANLFRQPLLGFNQHTLYVKFSEVELLSSSLISSTPWIAVGLHKLNSYYYLYLIIRKVSVCITNLISRSNLSFTRSRYMENAILAWNLLETGETSKLKVDPLVEEGKKRIKERMKGRMKERMNE